MKTIIAGGRNYSFSEDDIAWLDAIHTNGWRITEVVSGGANGADLDGESWARARGIPVKRIPADWGKFGRSAGPRRNAEMAVYADALIAFPGGRGTEDMIRRATKAGLEVCKLGKTQCNSRR